MFYDLARATSELWDYIHDEEWFVSCVKDEHLNRIDVWLTDKEYTSYLPLDIEGKWMGFKVNVRTSSPS